MLVHDFACPNPDEMYFPVLAERTRYFKESQKGVLTMSRAFEETRAEGIQEGIQIGRQEGRQEGRKEGRQEGRQEGREEGIQIGQRDLILEIMTRGKRSLEEISAFSGLPLDELKNIQIQSNPT